jgi:Protein of unknown function (DUF559)
MKNHYEEYGKKRETLPLEGRGKRMGVKGLTSIVKKLRKQSTDTERHLWRHLRKRQIVRDALLTPHPDPLPQEERGDNF